MASRTVNDREAQESAIDKADNCHKGRQDRVLLGAGVSRKDPAPQPHTAHGYQYCPDDNDGQQEPSADCSEVTHRLARMPATAGHAA
jgi:hypothetical protein